MLEKEPSVLEKVIYKKYIVEIRHNPVWELIDNRGKLISALTKQLPDIFTDVSFNDRSFRIEKKNGKQSVITAFQSNVDFINFTSQEYESSELFLEDFFKLFKKYYEVLSGISEVTRIGYRTIGVYKTKEDDFEHVVFQLNKRLINKDFSKDIKTKDLQYVAEIPNGKIIVGPVKDTDKWFLDTFHKDNGIDLYGFGIDIDRFNLKINEVSKDTIEKSVNELVVQSNKTESTILKHLF